MTIAPYVGRAVLRLRGPAGGDGPHAMTTYATTYGWRSAGVRRDLMTSPPKQTPVNGGRTGPTGVYGSADPITTNQKVAGSSPAERATKDPANVGIITLPPRSDWRE